MKHLRGLIRPVTASKAAVLAFALVAGLQGCNNNVEFRGGSADAKKRQVVFDQEFPTSRIADGDVSYRPAFGLVDEGLVLREKAANSFTLRQIDRPMGVETFRQGHDGAQMSEEFQVSKIGKLDLLVVIDDSVSMDDEQANLATKLGALTKNLKTTDWRIGVITTSSCALRNGKPIKAGDATADADFLAAINVGTGGSGYERGIYRAYQHLTGAAACSGQNAWLRADAAFAMLFVSDEDSYCVTGDCPDGSTATFMTNYLVNTRKVDVAKTKAYALIWDDAADTNCKKPSDEAKGTRYITLAQNFNGITGSICDADYTATLERISQDVSRIVTRDFDLKFVPANALQLTIDGVPFTDYAVAGKKITLNDVAETALKLKITYRYDPVPKFDTVSVAGTPDVGTLQVFINGAPLAASKYEYRADAKEIFFMDMPPDSAEVKVKFRKDEALVKSFDFTPTKISGQVIRVEVSGKETKAFSYDPATEVLTLDEAPKDGAVVSVFAKPLDPAILRYKIGAGVALPVVQAVTATDAATGEVVAVTMEGDELVFDAGDVVDGRALVVTYDYGNADHTLQHELAQDPLAGSVNVSVLSGDQDCINGVGVDGRTVSFKCNGDELEEVRVTYKYVAEVFNEFVFNLPVDRDTAITVYVDGARIQDYTVSEGKVVVPADSLEIDSTVRIVITQSI